jgi:hypothetical protein
MHLLAVRLMSLGCLRRRIKYTYREICSHGSKYEYDTCLSNYLPDCTASDPKKLHSLAIDIFTVCVDNAYKRSSVKRQNTLLQVAAVCPVYRKRTARETTLSAPPPTTHKKAYFQAGRKQRKTAGTEHGNGK